MKITFNEVKTLVVRGESVNIATLDIAECFLYLSIKNTRDKYKQGMITSEQACRELLDIEFSYNRSVQTDKVFGEVAKLLGECVKVKLNRDAVIEATVTALEKRQSGFAIQVIGVHDKTLYTVSPKQIVLDNF